MKTFFEFEIRTSQRNELVHITDKIVKSINESGVKEGICVVYTPHTTTGITINENADPDVKSDINNYMKKLIPAHDGFAHSEGNSDSHIKSSLFGPSLSIIITNGRPLFGTWQGVFFSEFDGPRSRKFYVKCVEG